MNAAGAVRDEPRGLRHGPFPHALSDDAQLKFALEVMPQA
jgi:hypothetical protein